ncbi:MAG TPA: M56 family metallopeptidase [Rhizomicrobium sp.]|jgi:beta-lactamase regulating signal transducer with metallopeptidase domain|nr:M56 family metallopeptidase [Rhizomicrobium sp.]
MSDLDAMRVLLFAGEALAASSLAMAFGWLAGAAKRASLRHLAWTASFAALLALPLLVIFGPAVVVLAPPAPPMAMAANFAAPMPAPVPAPAAWHFGLGDAAATVIGIWLAGIVLVALRHAIAAILLRMLRGDSVAHPFDASELPAVAGRLRHNLLLSRGARGPLTWGIIRPVILLPNAAALWPHDRLQAVLRHEFAHVARRDGLSQMLALAACALYWPNPLVWLGARTLRREAEIAADDAVVASGMAPSDYAGELLRMAAEFRSRGMSGALAMAAPSALPARVQAILAPTSHRSGVSSMDVLKMAAIAVLATGAIAAAHPSFAQDAPPVPPTPVAMATPPAAPAAPAAEPAPPAPAVAPTPPVPAEGSGHIVRILRLHGAHGHDAQTRIEIDGTESEIRAAMARMKPEMARAEAELKAHQIVLRQVAALRPQIAAEVKAALAQARAQLAQIGDEAVRAKVDAALARAEARIDHAAAAHADDSPDDGDADDHVTP